MKICYVEPFLCKYKLQADWSCQGLRAHQKMDFPPTISIMAVSGVKSAKKQPQNSKTKSKKGMLPHLRHSKNRGANMQQIPKHTRLQGINTSCSTQAIFPTNVGNLMAKKSFNNSWLYPFANGVTGGFQPSPMSPRGVEIWSEVTSLYRVVS